MLQTRKSYAQSAPTSATACGYSRIGYGARRSGSLPQFENAVAEALHLDWTRPGS